MRARRLIDKRSRAVRSITVNQQNNRRRGSNRQIASKAQRRRKPAGQINIVDRGLSEIRAANRRRAQARLGDERRAQIGDNGAHDSTGLGSR